MYQKLLIFVRDSRASLHIVRSLLWLWPNSAAPRQTTCVRCRQTRKRKWTLYHHIVHQPTEGTPTTQISNPIGSPASIQSGIFCIGIAVCFVGECLCWRHSLRLDASFTTYFNPRLPKYSTQKQEKFILLFSKRNPIHHQLLHPKTHSHVQCSSAGCLLKAG